MRKPRLRLHVRTVWSGHYGRFYMYFCLSGISLTRPNLRTTWDTNLASVYWVARQVSKGHWVQESERHGKGLYRLTGQVTDDPLH